MLEYHAAYYWDEKSKWYTVQVLDFRGVISQGRTLKSARWMIKDALKLMAECYLEEGELFPRPNPRARDRKVDLVEPIRLDIRVLTPTS